MAIKARRTFQIGLTEKSYQVSFEGVKLTWKMSKCAMRKSLWMKESVFVGRNDGVIVGVDYRRLPGLLTLKG